MKSEASRRFAPLARLSRYLLATAGLLTLSLLALLGVGEYRNSRNQAFPTDAEVRSGLERASGWILSHREQILSNNNPMLWYFVHETAKLSRDERLASLVREYLATQPDSSPWRYIFSPDERSANLLVDFPETFPDYNRLFIYGATCSPTARADSAVIELLEPSACGSTLSGVRYPWCRTHQLMGLRFVQKNRCEPADTTARTIAQVQDGILTELAWDFRVQDAYIQRVLMLAESGRRADVKAVWLRRVLNAQDVDGGWDGVEKIMPLPANHALYWADGRLYPRLLERCPSNFHSTAQGLYLLALWLQRADATAGPQS